MLFIYSQTCYYEMYLTKVDNFFNNQFQVDKNELEDLSIITVTESGMKIKL